MMLWLDSTKRDRTAREPEADAALSEVPMSGAPACAAGAAAAPGAAALRSMGPCRGAAPPPDDVTAGLEQAARMRPVPADAAPARRNVRSAFWRARAPRARNDPLMPMGRAGAGFGFAPRGLIAG